MPITYRVDDETRVIVVAGYGVLADAEIFGFQREINRRPEIAGYDQLIDMSRVAEFAVPSSDRVRDLAALAAVMNVEAPVAARMGIYAPSDIGFGLGRMFQTYRELDPRTTTQVGVFRTMDEALAFVGLDHPLAPPEIP
jgi:hypothetical protein